MPLYKSTFFISHFFYKRITLLYIFLIYFCVTLLIFLIRQSFEAKKLELADTFIAHLRRLLLQVIDTFWFEHLETMDYLRRSVSLRAYGQRDPLIEYRREGLMRVRELEESILATVVEALPRLDSTEDARIRAEEERVRAAALAAGKEEGSAPMPIKKEFQHTRNEFVTIKKGDTTQTLKFKKAEPLLAEGWEIVT